jgi:hypothetical protein
MKSYIFWYIMLCLQPTVTLISCLAYSSILQMEATCSSETSVDVQRTKRRYVPEESSSYQPDDDIIRSKHVLDVTFIKK